jgi:hypothetical protein
MIYSTLRPPEGVQYPLPSPAKMWRTSSPERARS